MGAAVWVGSALSAFFFARIVPIGRRDGLVAELIAAVLPAIACGITATALDFGGWREPEWRAGVFVLIGSLTAVGLVRAVRLLRVDP